MTWWETLAERWLGATAPELIRRHVSTYMDIVLGPKDWYASHRNDYARTGDEVEFQRMLRHVPAEAPASR